MLGVAGGFLPAMVMLILGALSAAGEFHHGTILGTYLVTPARRRVLAAKLLATGGVGAAVGLVAACVGVAALSGALGVGLGACFRQRSSRSSRSSAGHPLVKG